MVVPLASATNPRTGPLIDSGASCPKVPIAKQRMAQALHVQFLRRRILHPLGKISYLGPVTADPPKLIVGTVGPSAVGLGGFGDVADPPPLRLANAAPAAPT